MATPSESLKLDPPAIDPGTDIGHVHLKVADLDRALGFYQGVLGFELTGRLGDQAAFVSAGGYHHHIGLNTWESRGGSPPPRGTTGLYHVAIRYPTRPALARALRALIERRYPDRGRVRPRRERGHLPARPRRQRHRAVLGPAPRRVAGQPGRQLRDGRRARSTSRACWPRPTRTDGRRARGAAPRAWPPASLTPAAARCPSPTARTPRRARRRRRTSWCRPRAPRRRARSPDRARRGRSRPGRRSPRRRPGTWRGR